MRQFFLMALFAVAPLGAAEYEESVAKAHGVKVTRRYEMVSTGGGQLPGKQRLYASTPWHKKPFVIFRSERKAKAEISPWGHFALLTDSPQFQLYRLLLVDLKKASAMDEAAALQSLKGVALLGHFELDWIRELDYLCFQRMMATKPDPALMLKPVFLGFSADEKRLLMTYDVVTVLAVDRAAIQAKKTFKRRWFAINQQGDVLKEYQGAKAPQAW